MTFGDFHGDVVDMIHNKDPLGLYTETKSMESYHTSNNSIPYEEPVSMYYVILEDLKPLTTETGCC